MFFRISWREMHSIYLRVHVIENLFSCLFFFVGWPLDVFGLSFHPSVCSLICLSICSPITLATHLLQVTGTDELSGALTRVLQELLDSEDMLGAQLCVLKNGRPIVDLCAGVKGTRSSKPNGNY